MQPPAPSPVQWRKRAAARPPRPRRSPCPPRSRAPARSTAAPCTRRAALSCPRGTRAAGPPRTRLTCGARREGGGGAGGRGLRGALGGLRGGPRAALPESGVPVRLPPLLGFSGAFSSLPFT